MIRQKTCLLEGGADLKILSKNIGHKKTWLLEDRAYFPDISIQKFLKIFLSETTRQIWNKLAGMFLWQPSTKIVRHHDSSKNMAARGQVSIYKILKIFLSETAWQISI